MKFPDDVDDE